MFKVLVVDDNEGFIKLIPEFFEEFEDFSFVGMSDPAAALDRIKNEPFDVIITDLKMPKISGTELFQQARDNGFDRPIYVLSGHLDQVTSERLMAKGFAGAFLKPPERFDIIEELRKDLKA